MSYADSAIDYHFSVENIDLDQGQMTVAYYTADSTDGRPTVYRNIALASSEFNDLDIQARAHQYSFGVVSQWDQILEKNADNPTFDPADYIGDSYSNRYKPNAYDSSPTYNPLTQKVTEYDSEGYDEIRTKYTVSNMSDSEKADYRSTLSYNRRHIWTRLLQLDRIDSAASSLGLYTGSYDSAEIEFLTGDTIDFDDASLTELRSTLGYGDSEFADIFQF